jgi:hypothetical protein
VRRVCQAGGRGATGRLTGYAGGLDRKRTLLEIERARTLSAGRALRPVVALASATAPPAVVRGQGGRCAAGGQDRYRGRFRTGLPGH